MPPRGQKHPNARFKPGQSGNPNGRPRVGLSFAEKVRAVCGMDGRKLVEMWAAIAYGQLPKDPPTDSSGTLYLESLKALQRAAEIRDRITCSRLLAERGYGVPKQEIEHSGEVSLPTRVVHEYHSS